MEGLHMKFFKTGDDSSKDSLNMTNLKIKIKVLPTYIEEIDDFDLEDDDMYQSDIFINYEFAIDTIKNISVIQHGGSK